MATSGLLLLPKGEHCYKCDSTSGDATKWIGCCLCSNWCHIKCAYLSGVKSDCIDNLNWICTPCLQRAKISFELVAKIDAIKDKFTEELISMKKEIEDKLSGVQDTVCQIAASASAGDATIPLDQQWTDVVKKKRKRNLLVVKASDEGKKATEMKDEVSDALNGIQITDSKFTNKGNIVMNFEEEDTMKKAAEKLTGMDQISIKTVNKLRPKIMLCNVFREEDKENIIKNMIARNEFLQTISDVDKKIDLIFTKQAAGNTVHYILKCEPEVRALIHKNYDKIKLQWGIYKVRDRYHTFMCFHCQRFGHLEAKCPVKNRNENAHCYKCAGPHMSKDCNSNDKKCINCVRYKKEDTGHTAINSCCPVFQGEIERIRIMTDHGY